MAGDRAPDGAKPTEPGDAGFQRTGNGFAGQAHGYAILTTWSEPAERLLTVG